MIKHLIAGCLFFLLTMNPNCMHGQNLPNLGLFAGTTYYLGDINTSRHFYRPWLSVGAFYRYNINTRYTLRLNGYYAQLSGSDLDFPEVSHPDRPNSPASFRTSLLDLALQVEYNFFSYMPYKGKWAFTPYISTGIATALVLMTDVSANNVLAVPIGAGVKVNLSSNISAGAEWSFRKTFNDKIDGVVNPSGQQSILHNNDWYSFLGIFITFKFFNFAADCPAYN